MINETNSNIKRILIFFVLSYKVLGSIHMGGACRFTPSCSDYALNALTKHTFLNAVLLIFRRLLKCRPGSSYCGYDPVPEQKNSQKK